MNTVARFGGAALGATLGTVLLAVPAWADTIGPSEHDIDRIEIGDFIGTLLITVGDDGTTDLLINGPADKLGDLNITDRGGLLEIRGKDLKSDWGDWRRWFNWSSDWSDTDLKDYPVIAIETPDGTDLTIDGAAGVLRVGDIGSDVKINALALEGSVGDVRSATVRVSGSGDLKLGDIAQGYSVSIAGSGTVVSGSAGGDVKASIAGSGAVRSGAISGGIDITINGSGDAEFDSVNGPMDVTVNGAGDIRVRGGRADPMSVTINGSGDLVFDGVAVDPRIAVNGSGDVVLGGLEGSLRSTGHGDVLVRSPRD